MDKETLLVRLVNAADPSEQRALLDAFCGNDDALKRELLDSLAEQDQSISPTEFPSRPEQDTKSQVAFTAQPMLGKTLDHYKIIEQLGEGGMGVVYLAQQNEPVSRRVAIKITKSGVDSQELLARFQAERQALALMDHEHIAKVFDAGTTEDGRLYFVMELVQGIPITKYCDKKRLATNDRLNLLTAVCRAVQHAHQKGVVHRDLKPSNVLVGDHDGQPAPKIIDFGLAKALQQQLTPQTLHTQFGQVLGTLEYMSPEQASFTAEDIDTRTDVYSLGVLMYELLTGTTPLGRNRLQELPFDEVLKVIRDEEPSRPSLRVSEFGAAASDVSTRRNTDTHQLRDQFRGDLDSIVLKALAKDRNRRYDSAAALGADIQRHLNDEPIEARPPSAVYLLTKFAKRHRGLVAALSAVFVALALGMGFTTFFALRASAQRKLASEAAAKAETQAELAQKQSDLAMQTLQDVVTQIQMPLAEIPAAREVRQQMLEMAVDGLHRVADNMNQRTDKDRNLMIALEDLGDILLNLGGDTEADFELAERQFQQARVIAESRLAEQPANHGRQYDLCVALQRLSALRYRMKQFHEAAQLAVEAIQLAAAAAKADPGRYTGAYWSQAYGLSGLLFQVDDMDGALHWTLEAKRIAEDVEQQGLDLAEPIPSHGIREIDLRSRSFPHVRDVYEDIEEAFRHSPDVMQRLLTDRARYLVLKRDHVEAAATLGRLLAQDDLTTSALYSAGCHYSGLVELLRDQTANGDGEAAAATIESHGEKAVSLLRRALEAGHFSDAWYALSYINRDFDWDPVRDREDFGQLIDELKQSK